jgi:exopolysaccharide biosynthesis polyprenyl glycosylphosphotransferase
MLPRRVPRGRLARRLTIPRAKTLVVIADCMAVGLAVAVCLLFIRAPGTNATRWTAAPLLLCAPAVWSVAIARQRAYRARAIVRRVDELRRLVRATLLAAAELAVAGAILNRPMPRVWLVALPPIALVLLTVEREVARRIFLRLRRKGALARPVVMVGANNEALEILGALSRDPATGYRIVGFVSDLDHELIDEQIRDAVFGRVADLDSVIAETNARGVIIASTAVTTKVSNQLARRLTDRGLHVEITSTLRDITVNRLSIGHVDRFPTVYVAAVRRGGWRALAKRAFDIAAATALLVLLAPVLLAVALCVKLTSSGPVLFRQVRVGHRGDPFELLKFRTMVADAELRLEEVIDLNEASGPLFKIAEDPRVTRVGRVLRRTSLDELPQLWNVIRGEMSLVGPRPALPHESYVWEPAVRERLRVKPGITGMWQVNGRSSASFDDYVRLDLLYVDNWSLLSDLAILVRTLPAVFSRRGAL